MSREQRSQRNRVPIHGNLHQADTAVQLRHFVRPSRAESPGGAIVRGRVCCFDGIFTRDQDAGADKCQGEDAVNNCDHTSIVGEIDVPRSLCFSGMIWRPFTSFVVSFSLRRSTHASRKGDHQIKIARINPGRESICPEHHDQPDGRAHRYEDRKAIRFVRPICPRGLEIISFISSFRRSHH